MLQNCLSFDACGGLWSEACFCKIPSRMDDDTRCIQDRHGRRSPTLLVYPSRPRVLCRGQFSSVTPLSETEKEISLFESWKAYRLSDDWMKSYQSSEFPFLSTGKCCPAFTPRLLRVCPAFCRPKGFDPELSRRTRQPRAARGATMKSAKS